MSEQTKVYTLTIAYREGSAATPTGTQKRIDRFLSYIREHIMKPDPCDFSARVVSVEEQE